MCIIVSKPADVAMPSWEIIERCWKSNSDGAGFMYPKDGTVVVRKGFMEYENFRGAIEELSRNRDLDKLPLVMHFRISTQAGVNPENTHPFPISRDIKQLTGSTSSSPIGAIVHNGVIPMCSTYQKDVSYSDTLLFVKNFVARFANQNPKMLQQEWFQLALHEMSRSKLALMFPDGKITLLGSFIEDSGVSYSNDTYKEPAWAKYAGVYGYSYLDDLDGHSTFSSKKYYDWSGYKGAAKGSSDLSLVKGSQSTSGTESDVLLYECSELMTYWDAKQDNYVECDPSCDMYDSRSQLWSYNLLTKEWVPQCLTVYDYDFRPVKPPKQTRIAN